MPIANGSLGNCYRVTQHGILMFYAPTEARALKIVNLFKMANQRGYANGWKIEKWFIEGEF